MGIRVRRDPPRAPTSDPAAAAMPLDFVDFCIRAWREGPYLQVIAHSTPAGGMRQPTAVRVGAFVANDFRLPFDAPLAQGAEIGRQLARLLLPDAVWQLLGESLHAIEPHPTLGLRLRLCLDDELIDLPWELLYRRDVDAPTAFGGFLLLDRRLSLVREPPSLVPLAQETDRTQRGLFVGALFDDGSDGWGVGIEHASLTKAMRPLKQLVTFDFVAADATDAVERALATGCDLFHYAGHTEIERGRAGMVQLADMQAMKVDPYLSEASQLEASRERPEWRWSDGLAQRLARARTKLAVFNACNSGYWRFVRPLMQAGVPAVVGVQGVVSNLAALNFAEKLYQSLAVGLSLDAALTFGRLHVFEHEHSYYSCDWARFMAYMQTASAVLFPRPGTSAMQARRRQVQAQQVEVIAGSTAHLDGEGVSRMLSEVAARSVLILGRFSSTRKAVLDALVKALKTPPRSYLPILFDFEKPGDRTLIGSILRFASVSRFVIADLSDASSVSAELQAIVPQFMSLPVVPIIESGKRAYPVADDILGRASVGAVVDYRNIAHLMEMLDARILAPAEALYLELNAGRRGGAPV